MAEPVSREVDVAVALDMHLGESPVWSVARQTLHWVDITRGHVYAWRPGGDAAPVRHDLGTSVGCVALTGEGLLAATAPGPTRLRLPKGERWATAVANPEWEHGRGHRFNDGRVDPAGRWLVGTLAAEAGQASLYRLEDGELAPLIEGITISNGLAFSPDGRWLYHADSPSRRVRRHAYEPRTGELGEGESWVDLASLGLPGVPDGAAVDVEGYYWCALYGGGRVVRFSPQGELVAEVVLPCPNPTMVAFGGAALTTLYITTATQDMDRSARRRSPLAGSLLSMEVTTPGLAEPVLAALP